jgi:endothelin-converting enzyme
LNLEALSKSVDEENFDKMKAAYDACLNVDTISKVGLSPLTSLLSTVKKLYPIQRSPNTMSEDSKLSKIISWLAENGISALAGAYTGADDRDPDTVVVSILPPSRIGLPAKERYEDDRLVVRYTGVLAQMISASCPDCSTTDASIKALVDFEKKLAAASPTSQERQDVTVYLTCSFWMEHS